MSAEAGRGMKPLEGDIGPAKPCLGGSGLCGDSGPHYLPTCHLHPCRDFDQGQPQEDGLGVASQVVCRVIFSPFFVLMEGMDRLLIFLPTLVTHRLS